MFRIGEGIGILVFVAPILFFSCLPAPTLMTRSPDILAEPIQKALTVEPVFILETEYGRFSLIPRFSYQIGGVVIGVSRYRSGWEASLSPVDIALLWGPWAERSVELIRQISMKKRGYQFETHAIITRGMEEVVTRTSNNHLIPANSRVRFGISKIRRHDRVRIEGFLVDVAVSAERGDFSWKTSLDRQDSGPGACELILVKKLQVNLQVFQDRSEE